MDFGRLAKVDRVKFQLPPDHPMTASVLGGKPCKKPTVYVGCPVWSDRKMIGSLYPKGTKEADFLSLYSRQFNAIELNASGYGLPDDSEINSWLTSVPKGFVFCPKVPQQVARTKPLAKNREAFSECIRSMHLFGHSLGVAFLQLAPTFKTDRLDDLRSFIDLWDPNLPLHIELRHPSWFDGSGPGEELFAYMRMKKAGTVILEVTERRDVCHMALTTPTAFIRFDGHDLHKSDFTRLDQWVERIAGWLEQGLQTLYFFVHTPEKHLNPQLASYFIRRLNERTGIDHPLPTLLTTSKK